MWGYMGRKEVLVRTSDTVLAAGKADPGVQRPELWFCYNTALLVDNFELKFSLKYEV